MQFRCVTEEDATSRSVISKVYDSIFAVAFVGLLMKTEARLFSSVGLRLSQNMNVEVVLDKKLNEVCVQKNENARKYKYKEKLISDRKI